MDTFWALLILMVMVIMLFVIIPSFSESPKQIKMVPVKQPTLPADHMYRQEIAQNAQRDREMLESNYQNASDDFPVDFVRRPQGSCPESKQMSRDLPLADVPMCLATMPAYDMHLVPSANPTACRK